MNLRTLHLVAALVLVALVSACGGERGGDVGIADAQQPVVGSFKADDTELASCLESGCFEQAFANIAFKEGPKAALALFDQKIAAGGPIESGCHRIAHMIGAAALARYEGNVGKAFSEGSTSCWSGYYHGILERSFTGVSSKAELGQTSRDLCDDTQIRKTTWIAYQCVHGLGHGLMIHSGYNLPYALDVCEMLATSWDQTSCKGGVFMENISSSYGVRSKWVKEDDGVYPCRVVEENDKLYCYLMVTSRILSVEDYDWEKTARICLTVEKNWIATCFRSFGRDASGSSRQDPERIAELCKLAKEYEGDCLDAGAKDMTANYTSGKQASVLCNNAPPDLQGRCFNAIGSILGTFYATSEERRAGCASITEEHFAQCLRGADPGASA